MPVLRWSLVCWFVLSVARITGAWADDPLAKPKSAVAREHLSEGNKHYRVREFDKAIEEYKAGALSEDAPVFLYNLGQCYRQLGKYEDAIWHYERFLSRAQPTGEMKQTVEEFVRQMKDELQKKAMTQPPVEPAPEPKAPPAPIEEPKPTATQPAAVDPWYADPVGWGLTGAGVVGASVASYLFLDAADLEDQANGEDHQAMRTELRDKVSSRRLVGSIVGTAGVALLVTGVVKLAIHPSADRESDATAWHVGYTGNGLQVFGSF